MRHWSKSKGNRDPNHQEYPQIIIVCTYWLFCCGPLHLNLKDDARVFQNSCVFSELSHWLKLPTNKQRHESSESERKQ